VSAPAGAPTTRRAGLQSAAARADAGRVHATRGSLVHEAHRSTTTDRDERERRLRAVNTALAERGWSVDLQPDPDADPAGARLEEQLGSGDPADLDAWGPDVVAILAADRRRRHLHLLDAIRRGQLTAYRVALLDERGAEVVASTAWAEPGKVPGRREALSMLGPRVIAATVVAFSEALTEAVPDR